MRGAGAGPDVRCPRAGPCEACETSRSLNSRNHRFYNRSWPISEHFAGSLDQPAVFNRALTAAQVQTMFASGVGGGA